MSYLEVARRKYGGEKIEVEDVDLSYGYETEYLYFEDSDSNGQIFGNYKRYKPNKICQNFSFRLGGMDFANIFGLK